jgi:hypothetical protein
MCKEKNAQNSNNKLGVQQAIMYFNNVTNQVRSIAASVVTKTDKMINTAIHNAGQSGSLPNKIVSLTLSAAAAYAVGVNPIYIAFTVGYAVFFALATVPRWVLEASIIANLLIISTFTLPESNVTAFEYLILLKLFFEGMCCLFDKVVQFWANLTKDQEHSYYYMWFWFTWCTYFVAQFLFGFAEGFTHSISGM